MNSTQTVLKINNLEIWAYHGWYPEESLIGGLYRIDMEIALDLAETSLQLSDTVDYQDVVDLAKSIMKKEFKLIEESCSAIHNEVITMSSYIKGLEVTITKLNIPINNLQSTSFTIKL